MNNTMKIDHRRTYYLVLDVETANMVNQPLVYDLGFAICDKHGNVYHQESYIIPDIFFDEKEIFNNAELMNSAYYAEKLPQYYKGMRNGDWKVMPLRYAKKHIAKLMRDFNIKTVCAYNASFDVKALNGTLRYISKSEERWFFPFNTEVQCIWHEACQMICTKKGFYKFAFDNGFESEAGNVKTSAEVVWAFLTDNPTFEEAHTGLADVMIECQIMAACFKRHLHMEKSVNRLCWRIPQKDYKEYKKARQ